MEICKRDAACVRSEMLVVTKPIRGRFRFRRGGRIIIQHVLLEPFADHRDRKFLLIHALGK